MIGKDATTELRAYHNNKTLKRMLAFRIGRVAKPWRNIVPPIQTFTKVTPMNSAQTLARFKREEQQLCNQNHIKHTVSDDELQQIVPDLLKMKQNSKLSDEEIKETLMDLGNFPSLDPETQQHVLNEYRILDAQLVQKGMYQCHYTDYLIECVRYGILLLITHALFVRGFFKLSAVFFGLFWHQITFVAHDAGHNAITHNYIFDNLLGTVVAALFGGLSLDWWKTAHNIHHIVTNQPEHDPDIQHLPIFAVTDRFLQSVFSTYYGHRFKFDGFARLLLSVQQYTYYPLLCFGRFNLLRLSYDHVLRGKGPQARISRYFRNLEIALICVFWYWFGYLMLYKSIPQASTRWAYLFISMIVPMPLHIQITLSHFAMSTTELGPRESFPQRQLRTTMDVLCPPSLDFIHGGLQFQAIHHLFPRMPRHRLRECIPFVKEFCKNVGLEYKTFTFSAGNIIVLNRLSEVSRKVRDISHKS